MEGTMNSMIKFACIIVAVIIASSAQTVKNVQFKDLNGKSYDLYQLLNEGKYVYFMGGYIG